MGYSKSKGVIRRMLPILEKVFSTRETQTFRTENPESLRYRIREALAACEDHEEFKYLYNSLHHNVRIRKNPDSVTVQWIGPDEYALGDDKKKNDTPFREYPSIDQLLEVIGLLLKAQEIDEHYFPKFNPAEGAESEKLRKFCTANDWEIVKMDHRPGISIVRTRERTNFEEVGPE